MSHPGSDAGMKQSENTGGKTSWDRGWEEHKARQLRRQGDLPFAEKLRWLEEAQELGENLIAQANRNNKTKPRPR